MDRRREAEGGVEETERGLRRGRTRMEADMVRIIVLKLYHYHLALKLLHWHLLIHKSD